MPRLQGHGAADHQVVASFALGVARPRPAAPHAGPGARLHGRLLVRATQHPPVVRPHPTSTYTEAVQLPSYTTMSYTWCNITQCILVRHSKSFVLALNNRATMSTCRLLIRLSNGVCLRSPTVTIVFTGYCVYSVEILKFIRLYFYRDTT